MSLPIRVVLGVAVLFIVIAVVIGITQPQLFGFSQAANSSIMETFNVIEEVMP